MNRSLILRIARTALVCVARASALAGVQAGAQTTEVPTAFDSAGRVRALTPVLVQRLGLTAPVWPVAQAFEQARIYTVSTGGYVISVQREDGVIDRYPLTVDARDALMRAVGAAMARSGSIVAEPSSAESSRPARGRFVLNQMFLTALVYAPAAATLTHDGKAGATVWLLATGGSYFALSEFAKRATISRAQNHLASDGGLRGAFIANGALRTFGVDPNDDISVGVGLAGALAGAVTGYQLGKRWTDGEAYAASSGSTFAALTALGIAGATGAVGDSARERVVWGSLTAGAVLGYALGPRYPRRSGYRVSSGDIGMLHLTGALGIAAASIPFIDRDDVHEKTLWAALTIGMVGGVVLGDLAYVRPFDHTSSETGRVFLGAIAGGLVGGATVVLAEPDAAAGMALVVGGALAGTILAQKLVSPERASGAIPRSASTRAAPRGVVSVQLDAAGLASLAFRTRVPQSLLRVTF